MVRQKIPEHVTELRIVNSKSRELTLCIEPWGEIYEMPPESEFAIIGRGPEGDSLTFEVGDDAITVYGWAGSVVEVLRDGAPLGQRPLSRIPVPSAPPDTAHRETKRRLGVR